MWLFFYIKMIPVVLHYLQWRFVMELKFLREPIRVGTVTLHNRLVMPPMATAKSTPEGCVSDDLLSYYREYSSGKLGLLIVEHSFVCQRGKASDLQLSVAHDSDVSGLRELARTVKQNGTKAIMQINHAGSATRESITGMMPVSASAVQHPNKRRPADPVPREMAISEIREAVELFTNAAVRVQQAGFDGVEIHAAHGYLLNQFYSPLTNMRTDEYGGSTENRIRLHCEIIRSVRKATGKDFLLAVRLGGCDYREGGSTVADAVEAAKIFEREGVDLLDISGGMCGFTLFGNTEPGWFKDMTSSIVSAVGIPVILTGGVTTAAQAEELLRERVADMIGVGRAMFEDSTWLEREMPK